VLCGGRQPIGFGVNNAGVGTQGPFDQVPWDRQSQLLQLNITTLTQLTRLLLPGMIERRHGGILNVASTAAFQPGAYMAVYYASKAYVLSFSEAIAEELKHTGLTVTALCPGPTQTNFAAAAGMRSSPLMKLGGVTAESVARIGHRGFRAGRSVVIPGFKNQLLAVGVRFTPRSLVRRLVAFLNKSR
jgi:short-subunit dehydrogenase